MEVKDGIKIYHGVEDVREFMPEDKEFIVFIFKNRIGKEEIFVEQASVRNIGQFWNLDDAVRYAKFKKQEGDINSLFEKYERKCDQINKARRNLGLCACLQCDNLMRPKMECYECGEYHP